MARGHGPWCQPDCFGCKVATVAVDARRATPNRFGTNRVPPRQADPAWERGVAGERRPDGSFMPFVHAEGLQKIHLKEWGEKRHQFESQLTQLRSAPAKE